MSQNIIDDSLILATGTVFDHLISVSGGIATVLNNNNRDIDFQIKSTGTSSSLYYDASTGRLGVGITGAPDAMLHVRAPCAQDGLILESITNCPTGVQLLLLHNKGISPTGGDYPAVINLAGRNTGATVTKYAQIKSKILDSESLKTSGELIFSVDDKGSLEEVFAVNLSKLVLGGLNNNPSGSANYTVIGQSNYSSGISYLLIGNNNSGLQLDDSFLLGDNNIYRGPQIFSLSNDSSITGTRLFVAGLDNAVVGNSGFICGIDGQVNGSYNLVLLDNSSINSNGMVGIVRNGTVLGNSGIILGSDTISSGNLNINFGNNNVLYGSRVTAIGSNISSEGNLNTIFGNLVLVSGNSIISIGSSQSITGITNGILIGNNIDLSNTSNLLYLGFNNRTDESLNNSIVLGGNNTLDAGALSDIILIGQNNKTQDMVNSVLIGNNNLASGDLKNNIVLGSGNALRNNSYNNICLGLLTNQTGVYVDSDGGIDGTPGSISSNNINSVIVGVHNQSYLNLSNAVIGNKNITSGLYINNLGSFNDIRNTSKAYVLGNSNSVEGNNLCVIGSNSLVIGNDSIVISNKNNSNIYGSGIISIGNNPYVSSGNVIVGYDNTAGISGLIYGINNTQGVGGDFFTFTSGSNTITLYTTSAPYELNDRLLLHIKNPISKNGILVSTVTADPTINRNNGTTTITLSDIPEWSNRYLSVNNSFDENNTPSTIGSGIIMLYSRGTNQIYYGSNNMILGNNNSVALNNSIVVGNNSTSSGINNVIIGNNITGLTNNTLSIGTSNSNKVVISDSSVIFNTGTAQQSIIVRATDGTITQYGDLSNKRLGINTSSPRSDLDVSGVITSQQLRMGLSAGSGYVLTSDVDGFGSWTLPVRISGASSGLLFNYPNSNNKLAISSTDISLNIQKDFGNADTHSIDFYGNFVIHKTGVILNTNKGNSITAAKFIVWGSGGPEWSAPTIEIDPNNNNLVKMYNLSSVSGKLDQLNVDTYVMLPSSTTGTILSISGDNRTLIGKTFDPHSILYSDINSTATGTKNFRWFNDDRVLAIGGSGVNNNSFNPTTYGIVLSTNNAQDTRFNSFGLGTNFSIIKSGENAVNAGSGFHMLSRTGKVGINTTITKLNENDNYTVGDAALCVGGKTITDSLRVTAFSQVGDYLRVSSNGEVVASGATFDSTFVGTHPIDVVSYAGNSNIEFALSKTDNDGVAELDSTDIGRTVAFNGVDWAIASGLNIYDVSNKRGLLLGYDGSLFNSDGLTTNSIGAQAHYANVFAGGGFNSLGAYSSSNNTNTRRGTTQFAQYFLRTRTSGNVVRPLLMNFNTLSDSTISRTVTNTIVFPDNAYGVWTYTAYVNVMWSGNATMGGAGYVINGAVGRFSLNTNALVDLGYTLDSWTSNSQVAHNIKPEVKNDIGGSKQTLEFTASGNALYIMLWSATININQTHWPIDSAFTSTIL